MPFLPNLLATILFGALVQATSPILESASPENLSPINTSSSSLTQALQLGTRFPAHWGPDGHWHYAVRYSTVVLDCLHFEAQEYSNQTKVDRLMQRIRMMLSDPRKRNTPFHHPSPVPGKYFYREPAYGAVDHASLAIDLPAEEEGLLEKCTYGDLLNGMIGVNHIRLSYPELDFNCQLYNKAYETEVDQAIAVIYLWYDYSENRDPGATA
ncbi:MAG: hypothetical protein Q9186_000960 [Xanthomendoza sp. 1 TL-2023]